MPPFSSWFAPLDKGMTLDLSVPRHHLDIAPLTDMILQDNNAWSWQVNNKMVFSWNLPNCTWCILALPKTCFVKLNRRWRVNFDAKNWIRFWKKLWGLLTVYKDKVILWHVLNHGFFHHWRAMIWGVRTSICPSCNLKQSNISFLVVETLDIGGLLLQSYHWEPHFPRCFIMVPCGESSMLG